MKIFVDTGKMDQSAHFGWQNKDEALYGLREGYKNSADELVEIAVNSGGNPKILDTFIFPILFSYRHCLEISLKHIYMRAWGKVPSGGHNLLTLWDIIKTEIRIVEDDDLFFECIERIESIFTSIPTTQKLEKRIKGILDDLNSLDGKVFERGHKELGKLLGFISENPNSTGAPDPYWIINENNIVVSEDKIYEEKGQVKGVPISDVSEAGRHQTWIVENEKRISKGANIYTVLITNSTSIDEDARIYAGNIYYVHREEYVCWAIKALTVIRSVWHMFVDEGDMEWRESVHQQFIKAGITPKDYLDFVCRKNLRDI